MNSLRKPALVLGLLYVGFVVYLTGTIGQLPERIATHFDGAGRPNGWMTRSGYLQFSLILGIAVSLFAVAIMYVLRFLPAWALNIPNKDYWLAPERRTGTYDFLLNHSLWFACLMVLFVSGIHALILQANATALPKLSNQGLIVVAGGFVIGVVAWGIAMIRHFRLSKAAPSA